MLCMPWLNQPLPIHLVWVRHCEGEGNKFRDMLSKGVPIDPAIIEAMRVRHPSEYVLTDLGQQQAARVGAWLRNEFYSETSRLGNFVYAATSPFARAKETAGRLDLPILFDDVAYLAELNWGDLDNLDPEEREKIYKEALRLRANEPFFWIAPGGEAFMELHMRVYLLLLTLRGCEGNALFCSHKDTIRAGMVSIERPSQDRFNALYASKRTLDKITFGQVIHYSRQNPDTGDIVKNYEWVRHVRPAEEPVWTSGWQRIRRPLSSCKELVAQTQKIKRLIA